MVSHMLTFSKCASDRRGELFSAEMRCGMTSYAVQAGKAILPSVLN
jgi:hypothetical protein